MKRGREMIILLILILLIVPLISAGFFDDFWNRITGEATRTVGINVSVGVTRIAFVFNNTQGIKDIGTTLNVGPNPTSIIINFSAYQGANSSNLNESTAIVNITRSGESTRGNATCRRYETGANYKNFTCNVTMWWYDSTGTWLINASIMDNFSLIAVNTSTNFSLASLTGLEIGPVNLTWPSIGAGATNTTSNNDPLVLNNTGNEYVNLSINATNLVGETTPSLALYSGNFSISSLTGNSCSGAACTECAGSNMSIAQGNFANVTNANLTRGNFTINNGNTGQEQIYFCLRYAGSELTTQAYSIATEGVWTIRI